jgi:excinuclease ABC subunit A
MTELNDHLKLLFARATQLFCRGCGAPVRRDTPDSIADALLQQAGADAARAVITFAIDVPENFSQEEVEALLAQQGYTRLHARTRRRLEVTQDRVRLAPERRGRLVEALEAALKHGRGQTTVYTSTGNGPGESCRRYSDTLHCAECDIRYQDTTPNHFSFNSPIGACDTCRGFGRTQGIDYALVVPDGRKSLADGAVKPWQTDAYRECQADLLRFARQRGVPIDIPWERLDDAQRRWVIDGEGDWDDGVWYGARRFFAWLESRAYKMHIRVLLSRYRAYDECPDCAGARLKPPTAYCRHRRVLDPPDCRWPTAPGGAYRG